jgi:FtsP/CotA-like multicopper oxidase with cupredoxin domain
MRHTENTLRWRELTDYITVGAASVQSVVFSAQTTEVRVVSSTNCHINIGQNPTAAATDNNGMYLPANVVEYFHVAPGERLAVIQDTAGGTMTVSEMSR